jgi:L-fuculose-phosphate aldolase
MTNLDAVSNGGNLRAMVIAACLELTRRGLIHGRSGNVSVRCGERRFLVSPSGMDYAALHDEDVPLVDLDGRWFGLRRPSSEWRFHRDIYHSRPEVGAIVHTHSPRATALACTGRGIPAFHYMVAVVGGRDIRCARYHTFGSQALSDAALGALKDRKACLLANHGVIATGADLAGAVSLAAEVENLALQYWLALSLGEVSILDDAEMDRVVEKFQTYGQQNAEDAELIFGGGHPGTREGG